MNNQNSTIPLSHNALDDQKKVEHAGGRSPIPGNTPPGKSRFLKGFLSFWHDHLIEAGLILSMTLYYVVGNEHLGTGQLFHLNPLYSLPFLLIFAILCWYRLAFAVALLPLTLPYYLLQKTVFSHYSFSLAEITLATCVIVALLQFLIQRDKWQYRLSLGELRDLVGPFILPILFFVLMAAFSVVIAYEHTFALRAFREEVFDPVLYLFLALFCLRTRQDIELLFGALLGTGLLVALLGLAQYFLFKNQLVLEADGIRRVHVMYGSANSIGLFLDYVLPLGLALVFARNWGDPTRSRFWQLRIFAIVICLPLLLVLYLTQSRGAWFAIAVAGLFIVALSIRQRKVLLFGGLILSIVLVASFFIFRGPLLDILIGGHENIHGISTVTKRIYLWETALRMIHDRPWFGFGLDNWLCYYSSNSICSIPALVNHHYWILQDPVTKLPTGLADERTLSHPHNIFLQIWVSIGIFGLIGFAILLLLFYWLFARILFQLNLTGSKEQTQLRWLTIGAGATMLAALVQGLVDSSFLAQDLAFCFWMLVTTLLIVRKLSHTPWPGFLEKKKLDNIGYSAIRSRNELT